MKTAREVAEQALAGVLEGGGFSNLTLDKTLSAASLSPVDTAFCSALFYGVIERLKTIDYVLEAASGRAIPKIDPACRNHLRLGVLQILFMDKVPSSAAVNETVKAVKKGKKPFLSGFCNAVLRKIDREREAFLPPHDRLDLTYSCDAAFLNSLVTDYGMEAAEAVLAHSLEPADTVIRLNPLRTDPASFAASFPLTVTLKSDRCAILSGGNPVETDAFRQGLFHVQGLGSQQAADAMEVKPGDRVLDTCSAPGGKSFTMAETMQNKGEIIACDLHEHRVKLIEKGAARLGLSIVHPCVADATKANEELGTFDRILCDVPCSGYGMIAEKPDMKYTDPAAFEGLAPLQLTILQKASAHLKEGGRLVYSTCTLRKAENEQVVAAFLKERKDFSLLSQKTYFPHLDGTSGFFVAVMERHSCG